MKNVRIAFDTYDGDIYDLVGYQFVKCHMIFDVKMGENFRRKACMVAGGHMTTSPSSLTYLLVVSRDSVRIALTIAALNGLSTLACDIQNAYLTAPCRENIWTTAGPEFGSEAGKNTLVVRALYGLKLSGSAFRAFLAETLYDLGYRPSMADPRSYKFSARNALNPAPDDFNPYNTRTTSMLLPFSDPNSGPAVVQIFLRHGAVR